MAEASLFDWYRGFIRGKTRIVFAWVFSALLVLSAQHYPTLPGILLCFLGATLRFWASGYLSKDSQLSVGGPYSMTRNPLYLGTYLMAVGTALAIENFWLTAAAAVGFFFVYHYIILDEENKLGGIFGQPYLNYLKTVPRFFPRLVPVSRTKMSQINPHPERYDFSWSRALQHRAYEAYLAFAALIGLVALIAYIKLNHLN